MVNLSSARLLLALTVASSAVASPFTSSIDYLIVGGGPAGFVLAEQLSQNPSINVVLLEAGPDSINDPITTTPAYYILNAEYFWNYTTQPERRLGGRTPELSQGHVFGGGSGVNGMAYCRGASSVFDEWAHLSGNPSLSWSSMLEGYNATSHYTFQPANPDYEQYVNTSVYGNGPIEVSRTSGLTDFEIPFGDALQSAYGVHEVDMNDGTGIGLDKGISAIRVSNRTRSYARNTFGLLAQTRPNVQLIHDAWVHKIGFNGKTAVSVTYNNNLNNKTVTMKAKEIIVSGGAINTPKLLMLSGVGPKPALSSLGIPVVADIPAVGQNLRDHNFGILGLQVTNNISTVWQWSQNATFSAMAKQEYATNHSGPLAWNNGLVFAAVRVPDSVFDGINGTFYTSLPADRPHVLFEFTTVGFAANAPNASTITAWASLVQPEASGHVALASSHWRDDPLIYANFYGSAADKRAVIWGYRTLRQMLATNPALQSVIVDEFYPGPSVGYSDDEIFGAIQQQSFSFHHPLGTVAIGKALDPNWRVKGLQGLRVVDISAFPGPPTCHPMATVYAMANRAAQDIRAADGWWW